MDEQQKTKPSLFRWWIFKLVIPAVIPAVIGIGSAFCTGALMVVKMEDRIANLEKDVARHETSISRDFQRLESSIQLNAQRTDDQERRITRVETSMESLTADVREIKLDVKALLLRSSGQSQKPLH